MITDGTIALLNLHAQIYGLESYVTIESRACLIELVTLRGLLLGRIADYERADEMAEQLVGDAAGDGGSLLARARTRATFHRFVDALNDLDRAEQLSSDSEVTNR